MFNRNRDIADQNGWLGISDICRSTGMSWSTVANYLDRLPARTEALGKRKYWAAADAKQVVAFFAKRRKVVDAFRKNIIDVENT
jgi:DNA-binding IclR family transcriptional regulator